MQYEQGEGVLSPIPLLEWNNNVTYVCSTRNQKEGDVIKLGSEKKRAEQ